MTTHTLASIDRRARSAIRAAQKRFATDTSDKAYLAAIKRLDRIETDALTLDDVNGYQITRAARQEILAAFEAQIAANREARNQEIAELIRSDRAANSSACHPEAADCRPL
jgi:hypothetical protein